MANSLQLASKTIQNHVWFDSRRQNTWAGLPELPTSEEILGNQISLDSLPHNPVDKARISKEEVLEATYRILREEGKEGLRFSVASYRNAVRAGREQDIRDDDCTFIYTDVYVKSYLFASLIPIVRLSFSTKKATCRVQWQQSTRLTPGMVLAISTAEDRFETICKIATVAQRPFKDGLDQNPPVVDLVWGNPEDAVFDPNLELIMIEARTGFFEGVRHALVGLQHAAETESPLDKYLIGRYSKDTAPSFVHENPSTDLSSLLIEPLSSTPELCNYDILSGVPRLGNRTVLHDSQLEALQRILANELAIVQGPPGTGKTFTTIAAIKVMLSSRAKLENKGPIIVSAQTNHALDQLLSHCIEAGANIMRIGGQTESPEIAQHTIYEIRQRAKRARDPKGRSLQARRNKIIEAIQILVNSVFGDRLVDPEAALEAGVLTQEQCESLRDDSMETTDDHKARGPFSLWLGELVIEARTLRAAQIYDDNVDFIFEDSSPLDEHRLNNNRVDPANIAEEDEDKDRIQGTEVTIQHVWTGRNPSSSRAWRKRAERMLNEVDDLFEVEPQMRGGLYQVIQSKLVRALSRRFTDLLKDYTRVCREIKANRWLLNSQLVFREGIDIVGCTTTGLTKFRGLLAALMPTILVIEEAAETREANITSALYPSLQQLVLIGDHQQLAPRCDVRWLGEEPFNLNVSLFERMVNLGMPYTTLDRQRRMRPQLRAILNQFYPNLTDHPVVLKLAGVPGMGGQNFWFFDHAWPDKTNTENSKMNEQEADMVVQFYAYLVANGASHEKITILTYYNGQRKLVLGKLKKHPLLAGYTFRVHTIDSYQGEENDIVLLSLVRSPQPGAEPAVGFLADQRRAIVAISRARLGFYLFGNLINLITSNEESRQVWGRIWNGFTLQSAAKRSLGLPLVCRNHNEQIWIKELRDWEGSAGGCNRRCGEVRDCGHRCMLKCHPLDHSQLGCSEACPRRLPCGHGCQKLCSQVCYCDCSEFAELAVAKACKTVPADRAIQKARTSAIAWVAIEETTATGPNEESSAYTHGEDGARSTKPRESMRFEEMLIAAGAKPCSILPATTNTLPKHARRLSDFSPSQRENQNITEMQADYIAGVHKRDNVVRRKMDVEKQRSVPKKTTIVDRFCKVRLVDDRRTTGAPHQIQTIFDGEDDQLTTSDPNLLSATDLRLTMGTLKPKSSREPAEEPLIEL
ncbi:hypothetical protein GQ53DRAFT_890188 [Thozetella sp. PMI_491]|nr:hypothetical protein GQ53DRAFT_890188 [Thozetella sp. PMI_491]